MIHSTRETVGKATYFENIYDDNTLIAYVISYEDNGLKYVMHNNVEQFYVKGFETVAEAKTAFFKLYDLSK